MTTLPERLFTPLKLGNVQLAHRLVLPPLTRYRADDDHVPLDICAEYYAQRASTPGTMLIAEATLISPRAAGMDNVPGIWSKAQINAWEKVTAAVHAKRCNIFLQLWDLGRRATPESLDKEDGGPYLPSSASAVDILPNVPVENGRHLPPAKSHALTKEEIKLHVDDFAEAAKNAIDAGFDGVEVHAANGYLVEQFLSEACNTRADEWGGTVENRSRFCVEVTRAIIDKLGDSRKVAVRLSPWTEFPEGKVVNPIPQYRHTVSELSKLGLAYLHLVESRIQGDAATAIYHELPRRNDALIKVWGKGAPLILAGGYTPRTAIMAAGEMYPEQDICVGIGRYFLSTPDLPYRIMHGLAPNVYNRSTFYKTMSTEGYTDYPYSKEYLGTQKPSLPNMVL